MFAIEIKDMLSTSLPKKKSQGFSRVKTINASVAGNDDFAIGANKVYLTSRHPEENTSLDIATNNYDGPEDNAKSKLPSTQFAIGIEAKEIDAKPEPGSPSIQTVKGDVDFSKARLSMNSKMSNLTN